MKFYVIGDPVSHSLSPLIHSTLAMLYGIDMSYSAFTVHPDELDVFFSATAPNINGFNVTMPHKTAVIPYLKNITESARLLNSVNTVRTDSMTGTSTDGEGFVRALKYAGFDFSGDIFILGAGAVVRPIVLEIGKTARSITICNRTAEKAENIARFVNEHTLAKGAFTTDINSLSGYTMFINATPLGMTGCPKFTSLDFLKSLDAGIPVCDLIYSPAKTELLAEAEKLGHPILNGLPMLIFQAFAAFEFFTGVHPQDPAISAVQAALQRQQEHCMRK